MKRAITIRLRPSQFESIRYAWNNGIAKPTVESYNINSEFLCLCPVWFGAITEKTKIIRRKSFTKFRLTQLMKQAALMASLIVWFVASLLYALLLFGTALMNELICFWFAAKSYKKNLSQDNQRVLQDSHHIASAQEAYTTIREVKQNKEKIEREKKPIQQGHTTHLDIIRQKHCARTINWMEAINKPINAIEKFGKCDKLARVQKHKICQPMFRS